MSQIDQICLADYYLQKIPFASSFPYEVFLSFMSINNFLKVLDKYVPFIEVDRKSLLFYYLTPILKKNIKSEKDEVLIQRFIINNK